MLLGALMVSLETNLTSPKVTELVLVGISECIRYVLRVYDPPIFYLLLFTKLSICALRITVSLRNSTL
jgi:hypothetical protein